MKDVKENRQDSIKKSRKDCKEAVASAGMCLMFEALDMNGVPWAKPKGGFVGEIFGQLGALER